MADVSGNNLVYYDSFGKRALVFSKTRNVMLLRQKAWHFWIDDARYCADLWCCERSTRITDMLPLWTTDRLVAQCRWLQASVSQHWPEEVCLDCGGDWPCHAIPPRAQLMDYFNSPNNCFALFVGEHKIHLDHAVDLCLSVVPAKHQVVFVYATAPLPPATTGKLSVGRVLAVAVRKHLVNFPLVLFVSIIYLFSLLHLFSELIFNLHSNISAVELINRYNQK